MSFVPVAGPARFRAAVPPRDGSIEFSDARRHLSLPMKAALPILTKAHVRDDVHDTVALFAAAAHLALRLVAAGRLEPAPEARHWRLRLESEDHDRIRLLAEARGYGDRSGAEVERMVRDLVDAVADAVPTSPPSPAPRTTPRGPRRSHRLSPTLPDPATAEAAARDRTTRFRERLAQRLAPHLPAQHAPAPHAPTDSTADRVSGQVPSPAPSVGSPSALPTLVSISLRVEADEEDLLAGSVRLVPQVHDETDPLHVVDASQLWAESVDHGFGPRARTHASAALRRAAEAWPVLDRLLDQPVPDRIELAADEIGGLLEDGVAALAERGVDVLWPRVLGPLLTDRAVTAAAVLDRSVSSGPSTRGHSTSTPRSARA
ncbi:MAG: hypothetical protein QM638_08640, partial [Nocardioides sp.]